jgi:hypothetical protein
MKWLGESWKLILALPAFAAGIGILYKMCQWLWQWLMSWRDKPVLGFFQDRARRCRLMDNPKPAYPLPPSISEVATQLGRSDKSVRKSLLRLERKHKLVETRRGWELPEYRLPF